MTSAKDISDEVDRITCSVGVLGSSFSSHLSLTNRFKGNGGRDGGDALAKDHGIVFTKVNLAIFTVGFKRQRLPQSTQ